MISFNRCVVLFLQNKPAMESIYMHATNMDHCFIYWALAVWMILQQRKD
jgi:hypothetical protein